LRPFWFGCEGDEQKDFENDMDTLTKRKSGLKRQPGLKRPPGRPRLSEREKTVRDLALALGMKPANFETALRRGTLHPYSAVAAARALKLTTREAAFGTRHAARHDAAHKAAGGAHNRRGGQSRKAAGTGATAPVAQTAGQTP
jgi:hypothetical protein